MNNLLMLNNLRIVLNYTHLDSCGKNSVAFPAQCVIIELKYLIIITLLYLYVTICFTNCFNI